MVGPDIIRCKRQYNKNIVVMEEISSLIMPKQELKSSAMVSKSDKSISKPPKIYKKA